MKKLILFLSVITFLLLMFVQPPTVKASMKPECEYQFDTKDVNNKCWCVWNGIAGEFCGCPGC